MPISKFKTKDQSTIIELVFYHFINTLAPSVSTIFDIIPHNELAPGQHQAIT